MLVNNRVCSFGWCLSNLCKQVLSGYCFGEWIWWIQLNINISPWNGSFVIILITHFTVHINFLFFSSSERHCNNYFNKITDSVHHTMRTTRKQKIAKRKWATLWDLKNQANWQSSNGPVAVRKKYPLLWSKNRFFGSFIWKGVFQIFLCSWWW